MSNKIPLLLFCLIFNLEIRAQKQDSLNQEKYFEKITNFITVKLSGHDDIKYFKLRSSNQFYDIRPNTSLINTLHLNYRFISFSISHSPKFIPGNNDDELKGNTDSKFYSLNLDFNHWIQEFEYSKVNGYYMHNTGDFVEDWTEGKDNYFIMPDLEYKGFFGATSYKFNENLSIKSIKSQSEKQLKSAGSLMTRFSYDYYLIDNKVELNGENSSQKSKNLEALLSLQYFYIFVFLKNFYFSTDLTAGGGVIYTNLLTRLPDGNYLNKYYNHIYRFNIQGSLGYNSKRFFTGVQMSFSQSTYNQNNTSNFIDNNRLSFELFTGYRFKVPKTIAKWSNKIHL